jgi:hypothetical protein
MQVIVDVPQQSDLEKLIEFLKSLKLAFTQKEAQPSVTTQNIENEVDSEGYLSVEVIKKRYPNEWIFVANAQHNDYEITGGIVIVHHPDKRQMALQAKEVFENYTNTASFYTGEFPKIRRVGLMKRIN